MSFNENVSVSTEVISDLAQENLKNVSDCVSHECLTSGAQKFVKVCSELGKEAEDLFELPLEPDGALLLSTLNGIFAGALGLARYELIKSSTSDMTNNNSFDCANSMSNSLELMNISVKKDDYQIVELIYAKNCRILPETMVENVNLSQLWHDEIYYCYFKEENLSVNIGSKNKQCIDLIVLGMAWSTNEDAMRAYFTQNFGDVEMVQVKRSHCSNNLGNQSPNFSNPNVLKEENAPITNISNSQSKGYGFVRFVNYTDQVACLSKSRHAIDGRLCEVKIPQSKGYLARIEASKKIYVGGLIESIDRDMLQDIFSKYGQVTDIFIPRPFRNFAFITFSDATVSKALLNQQINCAGTTLFVNSASPKIQNTNPTISSAISNYDDGYVYNGTSGVSGRNMDFNHSQMKFRRDQHGNNHKGSSGNFGGFGRYSAPQYLYKGHSLRAWTNSPFYLPPPGFNASHNHSLQNNQINSNSGFVNPSQQQFSSHQQNRHSNPAPAHTHKGGYVSADYSSDGYFAPASLIGSGLDQINNQTSMNSATIVLMALELLKNPQILNTLMTYQQNMPQPRQFFPQNSPSNFKTTPAHNYYIKPTSVNETDSDSFNRNSSEPK